MSRTIAICNQKGGVGKSTTAVNVGACLAIAGKKTLLIDLDAQGNATTTTGINRKELKHDLYEVLVEQLNPSEAILHTQVDNLDVLPASIDMAGAEPVLSKQEGGDQALKTVCETLKEQYEFILLDCPPSLGLLTVNALVAADSTIIPVQCEYLALEGLSSLMQTMTLIKQKMNPSLRVGGIVLTMTDFRANLSREVAEEVKKFFKDMVFETSIPRNIRLAESPSFGKPICLYDPHSSGALAYQLLTNEVIAKESMVTV